MKNIGGVYSCNCPSWRNQSLPIERRSCKHIISLRGENAEAERLCGTLPSKAAAAAGAKTKSTVPALLLAHVWDNEQDVAGWWLSEKLDGVRAYWTGDRGVGTTRMTFRPVGSRSSSSFGAMTLVQCSDS